MSYQHRAQAVRTFNLLILCSSLALENCIRQLSGSSQPQRDRYQSVTALSKPSIDACASENAYRLDPDVSVQLVPFLVGASPGGSWNQTAAGEIAWNQLLSK